VTATADSSIADTIILSSSSDAVAATGQVLTVKATTFRPILLNDYIAITFPNLNAFADVSSDDLICSLTSGASATATRISTSLASSLPVEWDSTSRTLYIKMLSAVSTGSSIEFSVSYI